MSAVNFLQAQLDVANAQNLRLQEENALLRQKLLSLTNDEHGKSTLHIEAKLKAFKFEEEHDRMFEKLEKIKRKYNQLHEAYLEKVKRCKTFEDVFNRQKVLNGLVMKSSIDQRQKEQDIVLEKRLTENAEQKCVESLEIQVTKLQTALSEAYDIIDELDFEMESMDFLEVENHRLRNELEAQKKEQVKLRRVINRSHPMEYIQPETADNDKEEELPEYTEFRGTSKGNTDSIASSLADSIVGDMDPDTMERAALTESLINTAQSESNSLRRELLRSRLRKTIRTFARPTSSDA